MDFNLILEQWEKNNKNKYPDKDAEKNRSDSERAVNITLFRKMRPQAELDLHGLKAAEAETAVWKFLTESRTKGLTKVQIIHGKGIHSSDGGVLKNVVDNVLKECPFAGMSGIPDNRNGGSGSRWVILK